MTDNNNVDHMEYKRLSDYVYDALRVALDQGDLEIAEILTRALEQSMTRHTGGDNFEERREFSDNFQDALVDLQELRDKR